MINNKYNTLLLVLLLTSCFPKENSTCLNDTELNVKNDSLIRLIQNNPYIYCGKNWERFGEPSLFDKESSFFRLSIKSPEYSDSYSPSLLTVYRVEQKSNQTFFEFKSYFIEDAKPDSLLEYLRKPITKQDFTKVKQSFIDECFWSKPIDMDDGRDILDGNTFVIEASCPTANNRSHLVFGVIPDSSFTRLMDVISDFKF